MITYRPATEADNYAVFKIFLDSFAHFARQQNIPFNVDAEQLWIQRQAMYSHLTRTAEYFIVAESDGVAVGYARTILRDGMRELTEFFVRPDSQLKGVGTELLSRAFFRDGMKYQMINALVNPQALAHYLKVGTTPRTPIYSFERAPEIVQLKTDLKIKAITESPETIFALRKIDEVILNYRRDIDHAWLLENKKGFLYWRGDQVVGYGYVGRDCGPFALLDVRDYPAVLAHAESQTSKDGCASIAFEVPLINRAAVSHLLERHYRMDTISSFLMTDTPFGKFENYIVMNPPFFV